MARAIIKAKSDIFFRYLFGNPKNEVYLVDFINAVLQDCDTGSVDHITSAKVANPYNMSELSSIKQSILDIVDFDCEKPIQRKKHIPPYDSIWCITNSNFFKKKSNFVNVEVLDKFIEKMLILTKSLLDYRLLPLSFHDKKISQPAYHTSFIPVSTTSRINGVSILS